jgi:hypothetical protein
VNPEGHGGERSTAAPVNRRGAGWWVAGLTVVFAAAAAAVLFRPVRRSGGATSQGAPPEVKVAELPESDQPSNERSGNRLLREQATILDPTPLFLPTKWNASQQPLPATLRRQPEQVFGDYPWVPFFNESTLALPTGPAPVLPKSPLDLLKEASRDPFVGFDRQDVPLQPLPARFGYVEVSRVGDGRIELARKLERPVVLPAGRLDWQPAEFLVDVTPAGMLGRPAITSSSDVEEVDNFLRDYLSQVLHLGERLSPGVYRVVVGP